MSYLWSAVNLAPPSLTVMQMCGFSTRIIIIIITGLHSQWREVVSIGETGLVSTRDNVVCAQREKMDVRSETWTNKVMRVGDRRRPLQQIVGLPLGSPSNQTEARRAFCALGRDDERAGATQSKAPGRVPCARSIKWPRKSIAIQRFFFFFFPQDKGNSLSYMLTRIWREI